MGVLKVTNDKNTKILTRTHYGDGSFIRLSRVAIKANILHSAL